MPSEEESTPVAKSTLTQRKRTSAQKDKQRSASPARKESPTPKNAASKATPADKPKTATERGVRVGVSASTLFTGGYLYLLFALLAVDIAHETGWPAEIYAFMHSIMLLSTVSPDPLDIDRDDLPMSAVYCFLSLLPVLSVFLSILWRLHKRCTGRSPLDLVAAVLCAATLVTELLFVRPSTGNAMMFARLQRTHLQAEEHEDAHIALEAARAALRTAGDSRV